MSNAKDDSFTTTLQAIKLSDSLPYIALFAIAFLVRILFYSGNILGDDPQELALVHYLTHHLPEFRDQTQVRFVLWIPNVILNLIFGEYEAIFFLPSWTCSALLAVICLGILRTLNYSIPDSFLAALFVALSPFEVLMGTVRANDLFLSFFLALAFYLFIALKDKTVTRGVLLALVLWLAFYVKLWVVYIFPILGLFYAKQLFLKRDWREVSCFVFTSLFLHAASSVFWKLWTGNWFPLAVSMPGNYPVQAKDLPWLFSVYPSFMLDGSEYGTTLFGWVPYIWGAAIVFKAVLALALRRRRLSIWDQSDTWLFLSTTSFFLLVNFFPTSLTLEAYYSPPRIFRYLAPISFFMSFHAAKCIIDLLQVMRWPIRIRAFCISLLALAMIPDVYEAHRPGLSHRAVISALRQDVREACPPAIVVDSWQASLWDRMHLAGVCPDTEVKTVILTSSATDYFTWLKSQEERLPMGTLLVTGLISFVHYNCHECGFRINDSDVPPSEGWRVYKTYWPLWYDRRHEAVKLWRWTKEPTYVEADDSESLEQVPEIAEMKLFKLAVDKINEQELELARHILRTLVERFPESALVPEAIYHTAMAYYRERKFRQAIEVLRSLLEKHPFSPWTLDAHYHIGMAAKWIHNYSQAKAAFEIVIHYGEDTYPLHAQAKKEYGVIVRTEPLRLIGRALTEFIYLFQKPFMEFIKTQDIARPRYL